ncbi:MAG: hypothetical protein HZB85_04330 [Deltaproteobacteria bacterium]|nr:hypothetical protein [Deltaproteobacteria bacterium]
MNPVIVVIILMLAAFVLNLPFGYLRAPTKKFSVKWFAYIHLPIPFIIALRLLAGMSYRIIPLLIVAAIAGQLVGGKFNLRSGKMQDQDAC